MKPLQPGQALAEIASALGRLGFKQIASSPTGSRYFSYENSQFRFRLSTHKWTIFNHQRNMQVISSYVLRRQIAQQDVEPIALNIAVRFVLRSRDWLGLLRDMEAAE
jgi:hypothetical protein